MLAFYCLVPYHLYHLYHFRYTQLGQFFDNNKTDVGGWVCDVSDTSDTSDTKSFQVGVNVAL